MTRMKSHARRQTIVLDGTVIDEGERVAGRRYCVYTCYTCYARARALMCTPIDKNSHLSGRLKS